jgi:AbrB family looped-hinge helix DNA binding protein
MNKTDFIRKMDSMGRIVIPKDLRNKLNIRDDDSITISLNENHIELNKYTFEDKLKKISNLIGYIYDLVPFSIDVISTDIMYKDYIFPDNIKKAIEERTDYYSSSLETIMIGDNSLDAFFALIPLIIESNYIGTLFISKDSIVDRNDKNIISVIHRLVENITYL